MTTNKKIMLVLLIILFLVVSSITTYKVIKKHQKNLLIVTENKIINAAKKCYFEEKCQDGKITLKELYDYNYLEEVFDPITKEVYNEESYVNKKKNKFIFVPIE